MGEGSKETFICVRFWFVVMGPNLAHLNEFDNFKMEWWAR